MSEEEVLPRLLGGRYRLEGTLGLGGMGVVYRGVDLTMQRPIAVKLVRGVGGVELDDDIAGRFFREAKNTARLQHEHIIEVFDLGKSEDGGLFFVMELLEGEPLSARMKREGKLSPYTTVHIGRQICEALQVAHAAGVVHRDLKPANIMLLSRAGDDDFVKVLDFGVAKSTQTGDQDTQLTHTGMLVGTVDYMAPEQITGKPVDGRTDVYALGVVLYKMLSGRAPFPDAGVPALIHAHLNTMPKPLIEVAEGIPNELDHVVLRCMAKNPDRRFESMAELARALASAVSPRSSARLPDLDYGDGDDTVVGRSFSDRPLTDDTTLDESKGKSAPESKGDPSPDDATIKIDKPFGLRNLPPAPSTPRRAGQSPSVRPVGLGASSSGLGTNEDGAPLRPRSTRPMPPVGTSGDVGRPHDRANDWRSSANERMERAEPLRRCGVCLTLNTFHARACVVCGGPFTEPLGPAQVRMPTGPPTPSDVAFVGSPYAGASSKPLGESSPSHRPGASTPSSTPRLAHDALSNVALVETSPSIWRRFLQWVGFRR